MAPAAVLGTLAIHTAFEKTHTGHGPFLDSDKFFGFLIKSRNKPLLDEQFVQLIPSSADPLHSAATFAIQWLFSLV